MTVQELIDHVTALVESGALDVSDGVMLWDDTMYGDDGGGSIEAATGNFQAIGATYGKGIQLLISTWT